jgi:hypothetical protein
LGGKLLSRRAPGPPDDRPPVHRLRQ